MAPEFLSVLQELQDQLQIIIFLISNRQQVSVVVVAIVRRLLANCKDTRSHSWTRIHFLDPRTEGFEIGPVPTIERQQHRGVNCVDINLADRLAVVRQKILKKCGENQKKKNVQVNYEII